MKLLKSTDISGFSPQIHLPQPIRLNSGKTVAEGIFRPAIASEELRKELTGITGAAPEEFPLPTSIYDLDMRENDQVLVRATENDLPLIVCRDDEVIVNFDIRATQAFRFDDSKRPIYTYVPGFNIQMVPEGIRRAMSNFLQSLRSTRNKDVVGQYRRLPLTSFEFVILLLNKLMAKDPGSETRTFLWPSGKRAVFISLHDVDTGGFLRRRERDLLFRIEEKHRIRSTWFVPTALLKGNREPVDFLLRSGNEVGWHGHKHDHRLPFKPFVDQRVRVLKNSCLGEPENFPTGMRTPKLLKSNYLYNLLERSCPALCYDTSILNGIVPYHLWVNGRQSKILEIPTTVPTDIRVYNELQGVPRSRRPEIILDAQITRTKRLIEVGGIISIVTHPEKHLTERPDFLEVYDRYLSYIKGCPDIWFATAGDLFKHWTQNSNNLPEQSHSSSRPNGGQRL